MFVRISLFNFHFYNSHPIKSVCNGSLRRLDLLRFNGLLRLLFTEVLFSVLFHYTFFVVISHTRYVGLTHPLLD